MLWHDLKNIVSIYIAPTKIFMELNNQPRWFIVFIIISLITILIDYSSLPFKQQIMFSSLSTQLGEVRAREILSTANRFVIIGFIIAPISLLIKWVVIASILYYSAILYDSQNINVKKVFSVVAHTELIFMLMDILNIIILKIKGIDAIKSLTDIKTIVGLEYLFQNEASNTFLFTTLKNINAFTIWYVMVLIIGLSIISQLRTWKSTLIVLSVWFMGIGFQLAIKLLSQNVQTMMGK